MRFRSTRGAAPELGFSDTLLSGLAPDGGLYVPERWPMLDVPSAADDYATTAAKVMSTYVGDDIDGEALTAMCREAYATFRHPAVAPLEMFEPVAKADVEARPGEGCFLQDGLQVDLGTAVRRLRTVVMACPGPCLGHRVGTRRHAQPGQLTSVQSGDIANIRRVVGRQRGRP